jgi:hypothetical protein
MVKESQIVYQAGRYWVCDAEKQYTVYQDGDTHATADSSYPRTEDGLSLAKARTDYLNKRRP